MLSPIAYLTCEVKGRDFESRLLIAAELLKLGYFVVVGQYWGLVFNARVAPKGCYLFKTANAVQTQAMKACAGYGHGVVAADEEALPSTAALSAFTVDTEAFDACDKFLALNPGHKRALLEAFPKAKGKVIVAGTARADLLKKTKTECPHPAPYVLFNTGFGVINSIWGDLDEAVRIYASGIKIDLNVPDERRQIDDRLVYERAALAQTMALIDGVLEQTGIDVVIRPHPSERAQIWEEKYGSNPRVLIVNRSDPVPWIQHAAVMVHSDSTTGMEAAILGTPCLNLSPEDAWASRLILRETNYTVAEAMPGLEAILALLQDKNGPLASPAMSDLFPPGAAKTTARAIQNLLPKPGRLNEMDWTQFSPRPDVQRDKFAVSLEEANAAIERVFPIAGMAPKPVRVLDDSVFLLSPR